MLFIVGTTIECYVIKKEIRYCSTSKTNESLVLDSLKDRNFSLDFVSGVSSTMREIETKCLDVLNVTKVNLRQSCKWDVV